MRSRHPQRVPEYLQHILNAIDRATTYVNGLDFPTFEEDTRTQDAVIRSIEIIGEAANKARIADPEFAASHSQVPWDLRARRELRDYFNAPLRFRLSLQLPSDPITRRRSSKPLAWSDVKSAYFFGLNDAGISHLAQ